MRVAMIMPSNISEKAISNFSLLLSNSVRKQGIEITNFTYTAGSFKSFKEIIPKLKEYDIIHLHHEYNLLGGFGIPFFRAYLLIGSLKNKKVVTSMHSVLSKKAKFKGSRLKNLMRKCLYVVQNKFIDKFSDVIIAHGSHFKEILVEEYGVKEPKVITLISGAPERLKLPDKDTTKQKMGLSGPVYLLIGNLVPDHGAHTIIEQAKDIGGTILIAANPNPVNDRNRKRIQDYLNLNKEYVKNHGLENVRFDLSDKLTDQHPLWLEYFSVADFVLVPYRKGIASGIVMHSIAAGIPALASDNEFFNELANKHRCIKIVKDEKGYSKAIKESINPNNYLVMKNECDNFMQEFGWTNVAKKYVKIYKSLTSVKEQ